MSLRVERLRGAAIAPIIPALAALRLEVFREFPYLYEGDLANEARYLGPYAADDTCLVAVAYDGDVLVGASTAMMPSVHTDDIVPTLAAAGLDPSTVYYFGESVLRAAWRGRGLGHAFMDAREAVGRELGLRTAAFCAVERPIDHPRRPPDYVPHDGFWQRRGFVRRPDIRTTFAWRDLDDDAESAKSMVFWLKDLT